MAYSFFTKMITGFLAGTELLPVDNGGGLQVGATSGQIANAPGPAGGSAGTFGRAGNVNTQVSAAGVSPGATAADNVLAVFSLPASAFDAAGRTLEIVAAGSFAANGNTKRIKIIANATTAVVGSTVTGGTTIADTGAVTTSGGGWALAAEVTKYGVAASNTQLAVNTQAQAGAATAALLVPVAITATESGVILFAVTGNATTTASDIVFNFMQSFWQN